MTTNAATQFTQILWIFAAILVLYILFGVLFLVMSHLQERLQRRPEGNVLCVALISATESCVSCKSANKDLEAQIPDAECSPCPITLCVHVDVIPGDQELEKATAR
ncbi:hypothetical protein B0H13DRAFT_2374646 [Mycena leptocephala]|nr:hypothetical protein B0H13DRAFT_2374646 [Mycena leptocephala]